MLKFVKSSSIALYNISPLVVTRNNVGCSIWKGRPDQGVGMLGWESFIRRLQVRILEWLNALFGTGSVAWLCKFNQSWPSCKNGYLEKTGEGKQEAFAKAQDDCPPWTSWLKADKTETSTVCLDLKGLVPTCLLSTSSLCRFQGSIRLSLWEISTDYSF